MYNKRKIPIADDMEFEVYISSKLPSVVDQEDVSALVIFLRMYFSDRRQYRIISCIFEIEYEYLYGVFTPNCSYDKFLGMANSLKNLRNEFRLDAWSSFLPTRDEEIFLDEDAIELLNIINIPRDQIIVIGSEVFYRIVNLVTEVKGESKTISILKSFFIWHEHVIKYFIDNPQNPL